MRLVSANEAWLWAARRYRDYAREHVGDEIAARQLRRVQSFLMIALTPRDKPIANPYRATISVLVMLMIALGVGTLFTKLGTSAVASRSGAWEIGAEIQPVEMPAPTSDIVAKR